jgi:CHAD domain-containing protein
MQRFFLPTELESIDARSMRAGPVAVLGDPRSFRITYLDTFDWRLYRAGISLAEERGPERSLVLYEPGRDPLRVPNRRRPRTASDLPRGHLADTVAPLLAIRVLTEVGSVESVRRDGRIENLQGDMLARIRLETLQSVAADQGPNQPSMTTILTDDPDVVRRTFGIAELEATAMHDLVIAAAAAGRIPGDYSSKLELRLDPGQESADALRTILLHLLDTLEANVEGTIGDLDTEFLHDLRVATRRTRSALSQLTGVLPAELVRPFNREFKWLGTVTGPLRDLDVYLLEMPSSSSMLPKDSAKDLDPLLALIRIERSRAHRAVVRALRSQRFRGLITTWREALETLEQPLSGAAAQTVVQLADRRISKAYRRIVSRGRELGDDPQAAALHRLRFDAKKLRYLLEFFRSLYPESEIAARVKELKRLQDILGGFNDMEVQRDLLVRFAERLDADPCVSTACILSMGRLAGELERRQEGFRRSFHDAFVVFSGKPVRNAFARLFSSREPS